MDRIDIQVEVESVPFEDIAKAPKGESSADIRQRVIKARMIQQRRFEEAYQNRPQSATSPQGAPALKVHCNAQMSSSMLRHYVEEKFEPGCLDMLRNAMKQLNLSARAYGRILKVSRTIADLDESESITSRHIAEAISYRNLDRENWAE